MTAQIFHFRLRLIPRSWPRFLLVLSILAILTSKAVHIIDSLTHTPPDSEWVILFPGFFIKDVIVLIFIFSALFPVQARNTISSLLPRTIFLILSSLSTTAGVYTSSHKKALAYQLGNLFSKGYTAFFGYAVPFASAVGASNEVWVYSYSRVLVIWREVPALVYDPVSYGPQLRDLRYGDLLVGYLLLLLGLARAEQTIFRQRHEHYHKIPRTEEDLLRDQQMESDDSFEMEADKPALLSADVEVCERGSDTIKAKPGWRTYLTLAFISFSMVLSCLRPARVYDTIVNTIPIVLLEMVSTCDMKVSDGSVAGSSLLLLGFPFFDKISGKSPTRKAPEFLTSHVADNGSVVPEGFTRFTRERQQAWNDWKAKATKALVDGNPGLHLAPAGYDPAYDPLKISNLRGAPHPELTAESPSANAVGETKPLRNVQIRNILHITLESTRADVFPLRADNHYANMLKNDRVLKDPAFYSNLSDVTPFSLKIGGREVGKGGAGIIVHGAETQSSYSLKSHLYHYCGLQALPLGGNKEYLGEFYQPCMPHILKFISKCNNTLDNDDWRNFPWTTNYLQTASGHFDNHPSLLRKTGFEDGEITTSETLGEKGAKHPTDEPFVNSEGYREAVLNPYLRDIIQTSKKKNKRFFAGIWTISAHWRFTMPHERWWKALQLADSPQLNNYINAIAFQDQWLSSVVDLLKDEGVYENTLIVLHGDHGFAQKHDITPPAQQDVPVANPFHKFFQIPMLFHHPHLPTVHVHANATNLSVLPTTLDLLLSSNSTIPGSDSEKVLKWLLPEYEGQSLVRPLSYRTPGATDDYRFSLPNNGGFLVVGESSNPKIPLRFSVPLVKEFQYTASNMATDQDPMEMNHIHTWTEKELVDEAEKRWGAEKKEWIEKGIRIAEWWKVEMRRRWRYGEFAPGVPTQ